VGQLLPGKGPEWMGIRYHEQETGPPSKLGFFITFAGDSINDCLYIVQISTNCTLCKYKRDSCVQVKNKPCVECTVIMRLISWNHSHGSETVITLLEKKNIANASLALLFKVTLPALSPSWFR
jgi:hypothetical protein